jgi:hypothetical protein
MIKHITTDELKQMTGTEGLVLQGCGGDPQEWLDGINDTFTAEGILKSGAKFRDISVFGHNGLTNILFDFDGMTRDTLDVGKLAMWRIATHGTFGGTWLSDYLPNKLGVNLDAPEPPAVVKDADLAPFLVKLHAVTGCPQREMEHSLETLKSLRSSEYLLMLDGQRSFLTEAAHVYRNGSDAFEAWMCASAGARAFAVHVTEVHGRIAGDIVPLDFVAHRYEVLNASIRPDRIDAVFGDGGKSFAPEEWSALPLIERDAAETWTRHFTHEDLQSVIRRLDNIRAEHAEYGRPTDEAGFLSKMNASYMKQSENPQPDMLRITRDAARDILARGDAEVYRLLPSGAEKLTPVDAVKSGGLWYMNNRGFAIRREDLPGFDKWAERAAGNIPRQPERGEHKKSRDAEL